MAIKIDDKHLKKFISDDEYTAMEQRVAAARAKLLDGSGPGSEFLGWLRLPEEYDRDEYQRIKVAAERIRGNSQILVVIGIGGSYLGARAVIELLGGNGPQILFAGNSLSSIEIDKLIQRLDGRDWSINVISKSGSTTEPAIAFRILRRLLSEKYGDAADQRIYATTDAERGVLHDLAVQNGWERFVVPDDIGGRYSVLTAVGLLPIAAAGIEIDQLMAGARAGLEHNFAQKYAAIRNILYEKGFTVENLACFEPSFAYMSEWWKQLFGESEGKDGRGLLPDSMIFTTDLHSLGQYIQDGRRQLFETFVEFAKSPLEIAIPDGDSRDGLDYLQGKNLSFVNHQAYQATAEAHAAGGVPNLTIQLEEISAQQIGEFIYFMELACTLSAYTLGVNPFDQPGVEAYKQNMFRLLGKPK
jgi:glucose-6-phosphate isomerase